MVLAIAEIPSEGEGSVYFIYRVQRIMALWGWCMATFGMESVNSMCPYCGEPIELLVDSSVRKQNYIEDCQVCCKPITVHVIVDEDGFPSVQVSQEDEV